MADTIDVQYNYRFGPDEWVATCPFCGEDVDTLSDKKFMKLNKAGTSVFKHDCLRFKPQLTPAQRRAAVLMNGGLVC